MFQEEETDYDYDLTDEKDDKKNWSLDVMKPATPATDPKEPAKDAQAKKKKRKPKPKRSKSWRPPRSRIHSAKSTTTTTTSPQSSATPRTQSARYQRRPSFSSRKKYLEVKMGGKQLSGKLKTRRDTARVRSAPRARSYIYAKSGSSRKAIYSANSQRKTLNQSTSLKFRGLINQ